MDCRNVLPYESKVLPERNGSKGGFNLRHFGDENKEVFSLDEKMDIDAIFTVVKRAVREVLKEERSGLGLAFSNLPWNVGALWEIWGNYIVMNEELVNAMKQLTKSDREFNSFVFMILTHEYIHSLGYIEEERTRLITSIVANFIFGSEHPATIISRGDLWQIYPQIRELHGGKGDIIKFIRKFDSSATSYIA
jgi:hypothetical protein